MEKWVAKQKISMLFIFGILWTSLAFSPKGNKIQLKTMPAQELHRKMCGVCVCILDLKLVPQKNIACHKCCRNAVYICSNEGRINYNFALKKSQNCCVWFVDRKKEAGILSCATCKCRKFNNHNEIYRCKIYSRGTLAQITCKSEASSYQMELNQPNIFFFGFGFGWISVFEVLKLSFVVVVFRLISLSWMFNVNESLTISCVCVLCSWLCGLP